MTLPRRRFLHLAAGAAALPAAARIARADTYPSRPVHLVVGFPPGSASDINARLVGQWLSERLGQQFVVENRAGRRRQHRLGLRRARAAGRLHAALCVDRGRHQCDALCRQSQLRFPARHRAGRRRRAHAVGDGGQSSTFRSKPSPNSSPTPRPIRARSTWRRSAPAAPSISTASISR